MPSRTTRLPIQAASTGLWALAATSPTAWAVAVGSVMACGVRITSTASTPLSFSTISSALAKRSGGASPSTSTGLPCDQQLGQELVELCDRLVGELGQLAVAGDQGVGGHHARAAGIGDDGQPVALGGVLAGQELGAVEHVFDLEDPLDAGPLEGGLVDGVDAGHGPGVRGGGLGRLGKPARLVGHDRLGAGEGPRRRDELPRLGDRLDVQDDRLRLGGRAEVVDQVAHAHVEHVAHRDEVREPDALVDRPVEHRGAQRPGLRDEADVPRAGRGGGKAGVQVDARAR